MCALTWKIPVCNYWRMRNYFTGVTRETAQSRIESATLPVNPYGVVRRREEATRHLLLGKPNLFRSGQKGGERETRKPFFSGWAPNGDATGDLWTTCRCYGPINSRCRQQQRRQPKSHLCSLSPPVSSSSRSCSDTYLLSCNPGLKIDGHNISRFLIEINVSSLTCMSWHRVFSIAITSLSSIFRQLEYSIEHNILI